MYNKLIGMQLYVYTYLTGCLCSKSFLFFTSLLINHTVSTHSRPTAGQGFAVKAGRGVGGGEEYGLRSGGSAGSAEDSPKLPRPVIVELPSGPLDNICPWTLRIGNIDAVPEDKKCIFYMVNFH